MSISSLLNEAQLSAVTHKDGPLLILAGAGSGKTRVITYRIAWLISKCNIPPSNILAVTFTNKAAEEMKNRVRKTAGKSADSIWMSTFHSLGVRILRQHADKLCYTRNFTIYDQDDRERLLKECMHQAKVSEKEMRAYEVLRYIQDIKNQLITPEEYRESHAEDYKTEIIARIYSLYEEKIKRNNAMDFDDLISKPIELFRNNKDVLEIYRKKFKYILIDEYQDINNSQYLLISLLAEKYKNICVVGDDDQSIYKFRGADITNILDFEEDYPEAKVIRLEQNYRSTKTILKAAHSVIKNNEGRKEKELWTQNNDGNKVVFIYVDDEIHESESILNEVDKLLKTTDTDLKHTAVFYRTNAQSRVIEDRFRRAGIPYKLVGGLQFYGRMEIKDLLAYIKLVSNPHDVVSFKRIINVPPRGIGDVTVDKLEKYAFEHSLPMLEAAGHADKIEGIKEGVKKTLKEVHALINGISQKKSSMSLQEIIKKIITETGYLDYWQNDSSPKSKDRVDNIKELVSAMAEFDESSKGAKLEDFLNQVALVSDVDKLDENANAVTLMTVHAAKGLEFDNVFIAGLDENIFPHKNCMEEPGGIEEERRLAYVAITRARKRLYVLSAVTRRQYGTKKIGSVSRFINEIPSEIIEHKGRMPVQKLKEKHLHGSIEDTISDNEPVFDMPIDVEIRYNLNDKVKHRKMGAGTIIKIEPYGDDLKITVVFKKHGKKVLSAKYAGLEKI